MKENLPPPHWSPTGNSGTWYWDEGGAIGCWKWKDDGQIAAPSMNKNKKRGWLEKIKNKIWKIKL